MTNPTNYISQAKVGTTTYDIYALGLSNAGNAFYTTQELLDMVTGAGFVPAVTATLPAANATTYESYKNTITFVGETSADGKDNSYDEYVIVRKGSEGSYTYSWEVVGHTGVQIAGLKTIANNTGGPSTDATSSAGSATINGSSFSFTGTTATITVPAHTHTIGGSSKYLKAVSSIPKTFSTTSVITSLSTANVVSAGAATTVVTGYTNPSKSTVLTGVKGTTVYYKTASVTGTNGSATVATKGTEVTVVNDAIKGYSNPGKASMATISISYNTDAIKSYPGSFASLATTSIYPAADVTALTSVTSGSTNIYPAANITPVTSITMADISVSNGVLQFPQTKYGYTYGTASARATSVSVINSVSVAAGKSVRGSSVTVATGGTTSGSQIMVGLGTAVAATKDTKTVATGGTTTGSQFLTSLGTVVAAGTVSITPVGGTTSAAKVGSAITVVTSGVTTTAADGISTIVEVSSNGTASAITALGTPTTESVAKAGESVSVVTGANGTTNAYTGIASSVSAVDVTTTASGNTPFVSTLNANTGEKAAVDISYQPAGSIGGQATIAAHTHSLSNHTHSIPALSITVPTT